MARKFVPLTKYADKPAKLWGITSIFCLKILFPTSRVLGRDVSASLKRAVVLLALDSPRHFDPPLWASTSQQPSSIFAGNRLIGQSNCRALPH